MRSMGILVSALALLAACQEVVVVHESSLVSQISQMNKDGWQVSRNDQPASARAGGSVDPNLRVIHGAD